MEVTVTVVFTRSTSMLGVILEENATVAQLRVENFIMNDYVCNICRCFLWNHSATTFQKVAFILVWTSYASIPVRLRFGLTSSCEDLSRLWNQPFCLQGPIPVWMAPGLKALFCKFLSGIETSLQGSFWRSSVDSPWVIFTLAEMTIGYGVQSSERGIRRSADAWWLVPMRNPW